MKIKFSWPSLAILSFITFFLAYLPAYDSDANSFLKQILVPRNGAILRALFTPQDDIRKTIISLIQREQKEIDLAVFFFTDMSIANQLISAKKRGIAVSVVVEPKPLLKFNNSVVYELAKAGIPVHVFLNHDKNSILHHKFMCFGDNFKGRSLVLTGSFNLTNLASKNQENVIVTDDEETKRKYCTQFDYLKDRSETLSDFLNKQHSRPNYS